MITKFNNYIVESRKSIDDLEILTSDELGELLIFEVTMNYPDIQFIRDLLFVGCPIDIRDKYGRNALHYATAGNIGKIEIVKLLISKGADINARDDLGQTALHIAAKWRNIGIMKFLLSNEADVNARDKYTRTAWDIVSNETRNAIPELKPNK